MIWHQCDRCKAEITARNALGADATERSVNIRYPVNGVDFDIRVQYGTVGGTKDGDLCRRCIMEIVASKYGIAVS